VISKILVGLISLLLLGLSALALVSCDTVTNTYSDLAEARKDGLFERGWLPDILPPSAANIRTSNNLDLNISEGVFTASPSDVSLFRKQLQPGFPPKAPFRNWAARMEQKARQSDWVAHYRWDGMIWVFNCRAGRSSCEYLMWTEQNAEKPGT
jgi:hypothetical protein